MGARRSIEERSQKKRRTLHVWVYPEKTTIRPSQGLILEWRETNEAGWMARIVYVENEDGINPVLISQWLFPHQFAGVPSEPSTPGY